MNSPDPALIELVERYLDQNLPDQERLEFEHKVLHDQALSHLLENITLARTLVEVDGIRELIARKNSEFRQQASRNGREEVKVVPVGGFGPKQWLRVAAVLVVLLGAGVLWQYVSVNPGSVFQGEYLAYQLTELRSGAVSDPLRVDSFYEAGRYEHVISTVENATAPGSRELFLAGVSALAAGQYEKARLFLESLQSQNELTGKPAFEEETDYYLALAYLQTNHASKALELFRSIRENSKHIFHQRVSRWDMIRLQILIWKEQSV